MILVVKIGSGVSVGGVAASDPGSGVCRSSLSKKSTDRVAYKDGLSGAGGLILDTEGIKSSLPALTVR